MIYIAMERESFTGDFYEPIFYSKNEEYIAKWVEEDKFNREFWVIEERCG